jgi:hypothetical protein
LGSDKWKSRISDYYSTMQRARIAGEGKIPKTDQAALRDLGYDPTGLTPEQAQDILSKKEAAPATLSDQLKQSVAMHAAVDEAIPPDTHGAVNKRVHSAVDFYLQRDDVESARRVIEDNRVDQPAAAAVSKALKKRLK